MSESSSPSSPENQPPVPRPDGANRKLVAFAQGGCGCLAAFVALGLIAAAVGGSAHIDAGGILLLFILGGLLGLGVRAIYDKGRRDAGPSRE